ncbi:hypothetical protein K437DRAFT_292241 [Tilletiaria anomala UBC 951]|uniref:Uncharacterized protein n=1 Tax=Tilletiaria anomala (strain ATCC 24038 / CBS 436.72 / UBC 951) TaxID=1037660 RepID=A0A066WID4_TILAU|nr:uncharacterized protein K437DRAFT_292241 [Tilletiaria anomala UBC 951]KDN53601.1 hypothetical protein K437DRAFT_292241 [Tilletiaria anomala UBC 951]
MSTIPEQMKAACPTNVKKPMGVKAIPATKGRKDSELLLKIVAAGWCHTDIHVSEDSNEAMKKVGDELGSSFYDTSPGVGRRNQRQSRLPPKLRAKPPVQRKFPCRCRPVFIQQIGGSSLRFKVQEATHPRQADLHTM